MGRAGAGGAWAWGSPRDPGRRATGRPADGSLQACGPVGMLVVSGAVLATIRVAGSCRRGWGRAASAGWAVRVGVFMVPTTAGAWGSGALGRMEGRRLAKTGPAAEGPWGCVRSVGPATGPGPLGWLPKGTEAACWRLAGAGEGAAGTWLGPALKGASGPAGSLGAELSRSSWGAWGTLGVVAWGCRAGRVGAAMGAREVDGVGAAAAAVPVAWSSTGAGTGTSTALKSSGRSATGAGGNGAGASAAGGDTSAAEGAAEGVASGLGGASGPCAGCSGTVGAAAWVSAAGAAAPAGPLAATPGAGAGGGDPSGSFWAVARASAWGSWTEAFGPLLRRCLALGGASVGLTGAVGATSCPIRPANSPAEASGPLASSRSARGRSKAASRGDGLAVAMETSPPVHPDGFPAPGLCRVR